MTVKPSVIVTVIAFVLAAAAGVAIAGLPSDAPGSGIQITEIQAVTPTTTLVLAPLEIEPLVDDDEESASTTEPAPETSTTTSTTSTTIGPPTTSAFLDRATTTTAPDGDLATGDALRERGALSVATANATNVGGVAGATAEQLQGLGYVGVSPVDSEPSDESVVYYQPGFELEASRLANDLGWGLLATAPYAELPALQTDAVFELVALVGLDRV